MEISLNASYHSYILTVKDGSYKLELDIEKRVYPLDILGRIDQSKPVEKDIDEEYLSKISSVLEDMIYYRKKEFDSSDLITHLFEKLPESKKEELLKKISQ